MQYQNAVYCTNCTMVCAENIWIMQNDMHPIFGATPFIAQWYALKTFELCKMICIWNWLLSWTEQLLESRVFAKSSPIWFLSCISRNCSDMADGETDRFRYIRSPSKALRFSTPHMADGETDRFRYIRSPRNAVRFSTPVVSLWVISFKQAIIITLFKCWAIYLA